MKAERGNSRERLNHLFTAFKEEGVEGRSRRWQNYFDRIAGPSREIVLFGAGQFGQLALDRLRRAGVEPRCFCDNNQKRGGTRVNGVEVLSPGDAVSRLGSTAAFVVTVFNGSAPRAQLRQMGCKYVLSAATLFWKYPRQFMPDLGIDTPALLVEHEDQIRACFDLLGDDSSCHELCDQLQWRYWLEPEFLPLPYNPEELYFPKDLIIPNAGEVFVDCGAFDGDCIRSFLRRGQTFSHFYALEPDPRNRSALQAFLAEQPKSVNERVAVWPYAVSNEDGAVTFAATGDVASKVSSSSQGISVESRKLDSLAWSPKPTYIKMDIEGSEPQALAGGAQLLRAETPALAICLYHRSEHLWQIPNLIHSIEPRYSLFLRRYAEDCWEQVCYAVPRNRLV